MNNAHLIAACAVSKRNQNPKKYNLFTNHRSDYCYALVFTMYVHFNRISIMCPDEEECFVGSYFAPIPSIHFKTEEIEPQTVARNHSFMLCLKHLDCSIDTYVDKNINRYINSKVWDLYKDEIIDNYISDIERKYNVKVDKKYVDYSTQFIWEVYTSESESY